MACNKDCKNCTKCKNGKTRVIKEVTDILAKGMEVIQKGKECRVTKGNDVERLIRK